MSFLKGKYYIVSLIVTTALFAWLYNGNKPEKTAEVVEKVEFEPKIKRVSYDFYDDVGVFYAYTKPFESFVIKSEATGKIEELNIEKNGFVKEGDVIAKIDSETLESELKYLNIALNVANNDLASLIALEKGSFSTRSKVKAQEAKVEEIISKIEIKEAQIRKNIIKAPFDGYVKEVVPKFGEFISSNQKIAVIEDLSVLKMTISIPENMYYKVNEESIVEVVLPENRRILGVIESLPKSSNDKTHTFEIDVLIENKDLEVESGLAVTTLVDFTKIRAVKISPYILETKGEQLTIDILETGKIRTVPVRLVKVLRDNDVLIDSNELKEEFDLVVRGNAYVSE